MSLPRNLTIKINYVLDNLLPPIIRDSRYFVYIPFKLLFKDKAEIFLNFKNSASYMSEKRYVRFYEELDPYLIQRETSLNSSCIKDITSSVIGPKVLEVGCGKAYLAKKIAKKYSVTGADILSDTSVSENGNKINFVNANVEHLPFKNKEFDTTICTHTLEHVQLFEQAVTELRRVTKKRLILVVPMQRPYKYTFDLHLRFFPFLESFLLSLKGIRSKPKKFFCKNSEGDIFYYEDR